MSENQLAASASSHPHIDDVFDPFLAALQASASESLMANAYIQRGGVNYALVAHAAVSGDDLYKAYLDSFPTQALRQDHTCSCCKQFFRAYGNLVLVAPNGNTESLLFHSNDGIPMEYLDFVAHARAMLDNAKVDKVHYAASPTPILGQHKKGGFNHFSFHLPLILQFPDKYKSARQNTADTAEDVRLFTLSLYTWRDETLAKAAAMFQHDADLSRTSWAEVISKFRQIREGLEEIGRDHILRHNYVVSQIVQNRKGLARIGQTVLGEFLTNLDNDVPDVHAKRMFLTMIDPKDYMRPKAAPAAQTLQNAEKIVAELGIADSLRRRSLRRDELDGHTIWDKAAPAAPAERGGVFGAVQTKDQKAPAKKPTIDGGRISMAALLDKIDDDVERIEIYISGAATKSFSSFVTEAVEGAKPILNWDHENNRNPVSTYTYTQPVQPFTWKVGAGWNDVFAVTDKPQRWAVVHEDEFDPHFVLVNGHDTIDSGLPLFPQTLRPELHSVRSVIEAFCRTAKLEDREQGLVVWQYGGGQEQIRLTTKDAVVTYTVVSQK